MKRYFVNASVSIGLSILLSVGMLVAEPTGRLGVNQAWVWVLTAWQIGALAAVGRGRLAGWLHGASVQACWITYALATTQYGFVPGSALSIVIQVLSFVSATTAKKETLAEEVLHDPLPRVRS